MIRTLKIFLPFLLTLSFCKPPKPEGTTSVADVHEGMGLANSVARKTPGDENAFYLAQTKKLQEIFARYEANKQNDDLPLELQDAGPDMFDEISSYVLSVTPEQLKQELQQNDYFVQVVVNSKIAKTGEEESGFGLAVTSSIPKEKTARDSAKDKMSVAGSVGKKVTTTLAILNKRIVTLKGYSGDQSMVLSEEDAISLNEQIITHQTVIRSQVGIDIDLGSGKFKVLPSEMVPAINRFAALEIALQEERPNLNTVQGLIKRIPSSFPIRRGLFEIAFGKSEDSAKIEEIKKVVPILKDTISSKVKAVLKNLQTVKKTFNGMVSREISYKEQVRFRDLVEKSKAFSAANPDVAKKNRLLQFDEEHVQVPEPEKSGAHYEPYFWKSRGDLRKLPAEERENVIGEDPDHVEVTPEGNYVRNTHIVADGFRAIGAGFVNALGRMAEAFGALKRTPVTLVDQQVPNPVNVNSLDRLVSDLSVLEDEIAAYSQKSQPKAP